MVHNKCKRSEILGAYQVSLIGSELLYQQALFVSFGDNINSCLHHVVRVRISYHE